MKFDEHPFLADTNRNTRVLTMTKAKETREVDPRVLLTAHDFKESSRNHAL